MSTWAARSAWIVSTVVIVLVSGVASANTADDGQLTVVVGEASSDLYYIKTANTGTGTIEIHALSGSSSYQRFSLHSSSALAVAEAGNGVFQLLGGDLYFIKTKNTGGTIEVHVLTAASSYQRFSVHSTTALSVAEAANGVFQVVPDGWGRGDLVFIKTKNTGTGRVEVHVITAASGYQSFGLHSGTAYTPSDASNGLFEFRIDALYFIKTRNTGSGKVEVHAVSSSSGYQTFVGHFATLIPASEAGNGVFQFLGLNFNDGFLWECGTVCGYFGNWADLLFLKSAATAGTVEVRWLPASIGYGGVAVYPTVLPL